MTKIIPFETSGKVPAQLTALFGSGAKDLVGNNASNAFPVLSIKGKVFHVQRGDERTLVTKPGEEDPAGSIEVVVIKANPNRSKVFYAAGYVEGEKAKPTCYSNNGIAPEADAQEPQAKKCGACQHNQWGSSVTEQGKKSRACADSRRIAIATLDAPADPMLVRVPGGSLKALEEYGKQLAARGIPPQAVVTKIGFDYSVAWPALTFKPVGLIGDPELLAEIKRSADSELAAAITGMAPVAGGSESESNDEANSPAPQQTAAAPAPAPAPVPAPAPTPVKAKAAPAAPKEDAVEAAMAAASTTKKANVAVEVTKPAAGGSLEAELAGMLEGLDFDN